MNRKDIDDILIETGRKAVKDYKIADDTTNFMGLDYGDVMLLDEKPYFILRNEVETGFGQDGDPKFWVKRVIDLKTGQKKIIKLVFHEEFIQNIGEVSIRFFRSPKKEAKVLDVVNGHGHFMQGLSVTDTKNNNVRIIDFISGASINSLTSKIPLSHKDYFFQKLPQVLPQICDCIESLCYIHSKDLVHGDVRWDHIYFDREAKNYKWIDFDYNYLFPENPYGADLYGVGKILANILGKGSYIYYDLKANPQFQNAISNLVIEDFSLLEQNRLINLKKIFPYLPDDFNNILLRFSGHASLFYNTVGEVISDVRAAIKSNF
jgi:hypothetical protein